MEPDNFLAVFVGAGFLAAAELGRLTGLGAVDPADGLGLRGCSTGAFLVTVFGCFTCSSAFSHASFIYDAQILLTQDSQIPQLSNLWTKGDNIFNCLLKFNQKVCFF